MADFAKLIEALATLAWPAIAVLIILLFRPAVAAIIESAQSRKFTLKVGGQELTMEEAANQERGLIADLQAQVVALSRAVEGGTRGSSELTLWSSGVRAPAGRPQSVLWVDDHPKHNSYFVQQLLDKDVAVDLALSTAEALDRLSTRGYTAIVSDMSRDEAGHHAETAGLELLKAVRERDRSVPFIVFCSTQGVVAHSREAMEGGATGITSSTTQLFGLLESAGVVQEA